MGIRAVVAQLAFDHVCFGQVKAAVFAGVHGAWPLNCISGLGGAIGCGC